MTTCSRRVGSLAAAQEATAPRGPAKVVPYLIDTRSWTPVLIAHRVIGFRADALKTDVPTLMSHPTGDRIMSFDAKDLPSYEPPANAE